VEERITRTSGIIKKEKGEANIISKKSTKKFVNLLRWWKKGIIEKFALDNRRL
jgi:hypothetical protein